MENIGRCDPRRSRAAGLISTSKKSRDDVLSFREMVDEI